MCLGDFLLFALFFTGHLHLTVSMSSVVADVDGPPFILVPGDGGSQVEARLNKTSVVHYVCEKTTDDFFNIWLNMELLVPLIIDCWIDNMKLVYDNASRTTRNVDGVETRIPGFGASYSVEWLDPSHASTGSYFASIVDALVGIGYRRNITVRGAPYDFRKAPNENADYFARLRALVEETYVASGGQRVVLLAHSMGAPMCLHFLHLQSQAWKDAHVRALVTLAGVWGGSIKALKVYAVGDDLGSYVLRESTMREQQITSPSLAWLLPSRHFWADPEVLVQTEVRNYTVRDFRQYLVDLDYEVGWEMRKDVERYAEDFSPPGVEVHCLQGYGVPTVDRLVFAKGKFPDGYPGFVYGDGDGTVNNRSLAGCLRWRERQPQRVYHQAFPGADHMGILRDARVLAYVSGLVAKFRAFPRRP
ncbi:phospholipase A2 group XV-like [Bacillus rossius redtenbacheri]|uniref:phospholipase A2 group XV-like n=1 Tax=Bacillus rossius redtenbacheri TaxID=93214 RepID=UPI002FDD53D1